MPHSSFETKPLNKTDLYANALIEYVRPHYEREKDWYRIDVRKLIKDYNEINNCRYKTVNRIRLLISYIMIKIDGSNPSLTDRFSKLLKC